MIKEVIQTGRTVDAAIEEACIGLGCRREDCEFQIVDLPKKALFGLKTVPAKVRVWVEVPEEKKPPVKQQEKPRHSQQKPQPKADAKPQPAPAQPRQPKPFVKREPSPPVDDRQEKVTGGLTEKETLAKEYIAGILAAMKLESVIEIYREESGVCVKINGTDGGRELGVIIGHRGETLDALQYLTGLVVNRVEGDYLRVTVDCGDYRVKRRDTLRELAVRIAANVKETDISKTLEPMNPFERRIIHSTVSEIEGVNSISVGEEPNRRVVITTPTARRPAPRSGRSGGERNERGGDRGGFRGGRGGDRRDSGRGGPRDGRGGRGPKPPTQAAPDVPKATPEAGFGEFGKLDL